MAHFSAIIAIFTVFSGSLVLALPDSRIVGGFDSPMELAYHQASLRYVSRDNTFGYGHFCGGTLINNRTILTAAHCMVDDDNRQLSPSQVRIVGGATDRTNSNSSVFVSLAKRIVVHKNYNPNLLSNDIAVVILANEVPSTHRTFKPINIATLPTATNSSCLITGWGTTYYDAPSSPTRLQAAYVLLYDRSLCLRSYGYLSNGTICAGVYEGGIDSCQGDSGGPLVCNGVVAGVVSYGDKCALKGYPGVYAEVQYYQKWIIENSSSSLQISFILLTIVSLITAFSGNV